VLARQVPEEALAGESPELGRRVLQLLRRLELRQLFVALVHLLDVECVLQAREVLVVLLVEVADEAIGTVAKPIELTVGGRCGGHASLGYGPCAS
jgi:hypothetical protein